MKKIVGRAAILLMIIASAAQKSSANLIVTQWSLGSQVSSVTPSGVDSAYFSVVQNPFQDSHTATLGASYVTTAYDFLASGDSATFNISSQQHVAQLYGDTSAVGNIYFTASTDSTLTFSAEYDYNWPASVIGLASLHTAILDQTANVLIYSKSLQKGNVGLDPPFGAEQIDSAVSLLTGHNYEIGYYANTDTANPSHLGTYGNSDATFSFSIAPTPEPAAVALLAIPALLIRRRTR